MQTLMHKARPYKSSSSRRRVEEDNENNFDGSYNLQFGQCVDVKLLDNDLFNDDVIEYTKAGSIISTKSYVLFHVCQQGACDSASEDDLYLLDLSSYVQYVASYHASVKGDYCTACDTYYNDFCGAYQAASNDDAVAATAYEATYEDAGQHSRRTTSYITCNQCEAYGCTGNSDDAADADDNDKAAVQLIEELSTCMNTGVEWNGNSLYVGFMCSSSSGNGVEIAVFLDNRCTVYTNQKRFSEIPSWYIYDSADTFAMAETYIKSAFTMTTSCSSVEFGDPANQSDDAVTNDDAVANDDAVVYQEAQVDANDYCVNIFQSGMVAFNSCAQNDDQSNNNDDYSQNMLNADDYIAFYEYDMSYYDLAELDTVCAVVQQKEQAYSYYYNVEKSGSWNNFESGNKSRSFFWSNLNLGSKTTICIGVISAIAVSALVIVAIREKRRKRRERMTEPVYKGTSFGRIM